MLWRTLNKVNLGEYPGAGPTKKIPRSTKLERQLQRQSLGKSAGQTSTVYIHMYISLYGGMHQRSANKNTNERASIQATAGVNTSHTHTHSYTENRTGKRTSEGVVTGWQGGERHPLWPAISHVNNKATATAAEASQATQNCANVGQLWAGHQSNESWATSTGLCLHIIPGPGAGGASGAGPGAPHALFAPLCTVESHMRPSSHSTVN